MKTIFSKLSELESMQARAKTEGAKNHLQIEIDKLKRQLINESEDSLLYI